jgi:kumamolisin
VVDFATHAGLSVLEKSPSKRSLRLKGSIASLSKAFEVKLRRYSHKTGDYRGRVGALKIPAELQGIVRAVLGLDNRRVGRSYRRLATHGSLSRARQSAAFLPTQLAKLYNFPATVDGAGECVGILAFNGAVADTGVTAPGGYKVSGLKKYFGTSTQTRLPSITDVVVHGPGNTPGDETDQNDTTGEILLDIETAGSIAPGARFVVYFTEFTEQGWVDALHAAIHDTTNNPSVLSISYGNPETSSDASSPDQRGSLWTASAIEQTSMAFEDAALKNITICCASGDSGSSDGGDDGLAHVDFPASSPYVLGCGGTRVQVAQGMLAREAVWNNGRQGGSGGGGVSDIFPLPDWQQGVDVPVSVNPGSRIGRGVPDVASDADPSTGVLVSDVDGNVDPSAAVGGTSAAAPLWAALIARLNQSLGAPVGYLNPLLYRNCAQGVLRDVTTGDNGAYRATAGRDACTGLGTPNGASLLAALAAPPIAVLPQPVDSVSTSPHTASLELRVAALEALLNRIISPTGPTGRAPSGPHKGVGTNLGQS